MSAKTILDLRWMPMFGDWEQNDKREIVFHGREIPNSAQRNVMTSEGVNGEILDRIVTYGQVVFNERFTEGKIRFRLEFHSPDHRSNMALVLQTNIASNNILMFGLMGGFIDRENETGFLYALRRYGPAVGAAADRSGANVAGPVLSDLFKGGEGKNLRGSTPYDIEIIVKGATISALVNSVEVMRHILDQPSLSGEQIGLFGGSRGDVIISELQIEPETPTAFVIMQFNTHEYESLYNEVISPMCISLGLQPYRGDSTYLPGLIIEDIKKQIEEAKVIIAEVTPNNANVYFEVGYADALKKPIILIADRKEGLKPFDVSAYRTIFYDNSIGGKRKVENDLRSYLNSILGK